MRIARKLILLALMAMAAMAFAASSASAQIEVSQEGGAHCPAAGCVVHATSEAEVDLELFGEVLTSCLNEFEANIGEDGVGEIYSQTLTGPLCAAEPCETVAGSPDPWPIVGDETAGVETLFATFCVDIHSVGLQTLCANAPINIVSVGHAQEFSANAAVCENDPFTHVTGHWNTETDENHGSIEITH